MGTLIALDKDLIWVHGGSSPTPPEPDIPDGTTAIPINDVVIWQKCAGLTQQYDTLAEVLADSGIVRTLMNSKNAVNYLVRSTTWASDVCADQTAMTYIGANDYASNTLLADSDWNTAIQNSTYFESVDNVKVPAMTSNTTPSGECFADSQLNASYSAFKAFDGNDDNAWASVSGDTFPHYVGYHFPSSVRVHKAKIGYRTAGVGGVQHITVKNFNIQGSIDGNSYINLYTGIATDSTEAYSAEYNFNNNNDYTYYRLYVTSTYASTNPCTCSMLQFYGRQNGGVQSWLTAGGVTDKNYTTLSQVLNDPVTLQTLMQSENAVNYLVTCKGWIDEICSNENAMTYIGYSNYASNTLLADSDWRVKICTSTYFESVLNAKVPVMTGNTEPSGECSFTNLSNSGLYGSSQPYQAFDGNTTVCYMSGNSNSFGRFIYKFDSPLKIYRCDLDMINTYFPQYTNSGSYPRRVVKSSDGTNYTSLKECYSAVVNQSVFSWNFDNDEDAEYFGVELGNINSTQSYTGVRECQFYGRVDI